jgi:hypothetical protein
MAGAICHHESSNGYARQRDEGSRSDRNPINIDITDVYRGLVLQAGIVPQGLRGNKLLHSEVFGHIRGDYFHHAGSHTAQATQAT